MPDARLIKKKICVDNKVAKLSMQSAFIFTWMILFTDREGKMVANSEILKGSAFPFIKELSAEKINKSLIEIESVGLIIRYKIDEVEYCKFPSFVKNHAPTALAKEAQSVIPDPNENEIKTYERPTPELLKNKAVVSSYDFESVFARYPKKTAKAKCIEKMKSTVKTDEDLANLNKSLTNYMAVVEEDREKGFKDRAWKDALTFFGNWKDYIEVETESQRIIREKEEKEKKLEAEMKAKKAKFYAENPDFKREEE